MIRVRDLRLDAPAGRPAPRDPLLHVPALEIRSGEYMAIAGPNGAGKTLLLTLLAGLRPPSAGQIEFDTSNMSRPAVGIVFQSPDDQIVGSTVERDLAFGLENLAVPPPEIRRRVDAALAEAGLASRASVPPHLLSEGEKQRLALAAARIRDPAVLLLDEPTARLDPAARAALLAALDRGARGDVTVLHVTHRSEELVRADRILGMRDGAPVFDGDPARLLADPAADALGILWSGPHRLRRELARRGRPVPPPASGDWNDAAALVAGIAG